MIKNIKTPIRYHYVKLTGLFTCLYGKIYVNLQNYIFFKVTTNKVLE